MQHTNVKDWAGERSSDPAQRFQFSKCQLARLPVCLSGGTSEYSKTKF